MSKETWTDSNKELIVTLFNLTTEKEIEDTLMKLNLVEAAWDNHEDFSILDLVDSWNNISNKNIISMNQLLNAFYKVSVTASSEEISTEVINVLVTYNLIATREQGLEIGNALKSVITRLKNDKVKDDLSKHGIEVSDCDSFIDVLDKTKCTLNLLTNEEEKSSKLKLIAEIIGGKYNLSRVRLLLEN